MAHTPSFAEIALPIPVEQLFTYSLPNGMSDMAKPGCRVFVSFRNRLMTGVITGLTDSCSVPRIKPVLEVLDTEPVLDSQLLELTRWIAQYYLCSWGEAIRTALPAGMLNEADQLVTVSESCTEEDLNQLAGSAPRQAQVLTCLMAHESLSVSRLKRLTGISDVFGPLRSLETKGYVAATVGEPEREPAIKLETWVKLAVNQDDAREAVAELARRAPRQASCVNLLISHGGKLAASQLKHLGNIERRVVNDLVGKDLLETYEVEVQRDPYRDDTLEPPEQIVYTDEQAAALATIEPCIDERTFSPFLLYGVTGSGKTQVYIRAIEKNLLAGRGAIVLVPELALTPQTVRQFRAHFGNKVAVLHSGLSSGERYDSWRAIRSGRLPIVVGARSAIFAPVKELGLIVVDEEHESSYKQFEDPPLYNARDVAVYRARLASAVAILGSATPSLESFTNGRNGKFKCCELRQRVDDRDLPKVTTIDMRDEHKEGHWEVFSRELMARMEDRLERGEQIILFLNRRGFSTFLLCSDCGHTISCPYCSVTLTYHADSLLLRCHYCDHRIDAPSECPKCHSRYLRFKGTGTQRIEDELKAQYPDAVIARMDMDTTSRKNAHRDIYQQFLNREADILLGTQMVAKGFDFPHVTLVGVISADTTLNLPDFRAGERTFQLLTQVAGRTGRGDLGGEVIVQTYSLNHHSIVTASSHDYDSFYMREIEERRELDYPPFGRMVGVLFQGSRENHVAAEARRFTDVLRRGNRSLAILGPAPSVVAKVREQFRYHVLVRSMEAAKMRFAVQEARRVWEADIDKKLIHLRIDVDPVGMM